MASEKLENWPCVGSHVQLSVQYGIEIRIWSLSQDNSHSWVRISHGTNKYVVDSNYNNTDILSDLPEEQASQLIVKDFGARSKEKAKQRRELVDLPSIIRMSERKWIEIEPGESSLSAYKISKKVINLLRHCQTIQRSSSILENQVLSSESSFTNTSLV